MGKVAASVLRTLTVLYLFAWCTVAGFLIAFGVQGFRALDTFFRAAGTTPTTIIREVNKGLTTLPQQEQGHKNILVLGVDEVAGRPEASVLTDTIMLVSADFEDGSVSMLPLPRDLWINAYKTKVNAFYQYGRDKYPEEPERYTREIVEEITGVKIHHTFVVRIGDLETLIDALGGIDVEVPRSFEDPLFPREGVDVAVVRDPALLYETVAFEAGVEHMSGKRAMQYIRSRHSTDRIEGTDDARARRQQDVMMAVAKRITSPDVFLRPKRMGALYLWYQETYGNVFSAAELVSTAKALVPVANMLSFRPRSVSIQEQGNDGTIYHPRALLQGQWVYLPVDPTWKAFGEEVRGALE